MPSQQEYLLETKNLGISFGGLKAVQNVNLRVKKGALYGLIGPNGAGKTTVFNILTGVYKPTEGEFYIDGENLTGLSQAAVCKKGVARTFQNIRLFNNMSVIKNVLISLANHPEYKCNLLQSIFRTNRYYETEKAMRSEAKEILDVFGLLNERNVLSCSLPYGKQRKLEIARAIATRPKLLLLDEPAAGMNPAETVDLMENIVRIRDDFKIAVLLIEHDMKLVMGICEGICVLNFGKVIAKGTAEEIQSNPVVIEAYLGNRKEN